MKPSELLDKPEKWTKYVLARGSYGQVVRYTSPDAYSFCLNGALMHCFKLDEGSYMKAFNKVTMEVPDGRVASWNDAPERTFEEVRALLLKLDL